MDSTPRTLLVFAAEGCEPFLMDELRRQHPAATSALLSDRWIQTALPRGGCKPPALVFARQALFEPESVTAPSISAWSGQLLKALLSRAEPARPWRLHVAPDCGAGAAGRHRCELIRDALRDQLRQKRRSVLRALRDDTSPFTPGDSLVQLILTAPDRGWLSAAPAPLPFEYRRAMSAFPLGEVSVASDKAAPSRAFAKMVEAGLRLGRRIEADETCVDLGASPGSWSYVALQRGARVVAVDRSPLRHDLMRNPRLEFVRGDAFKFRPAAPVDWLLCDVIAAPERSIALLLDWLRAGLARRFVVTIKFKGTSDYAKLDELKAALPGLCDEWFLTRLCANKNEVCAFGWRD
jgi:23S rRNA (cytidine2498-2'-O)-methyltransferase